MTGELRRVRSDELRWQAQAAEAADELRRLDGFGPFVLMRRWFGDAAEHAEVARARIAQARHEQDGIDAAAAPLLERQRELAARRRTFTGVEARYAAAAEAKAAALVRAGGELAARAEQSAARLAELAGELRTFEGIVATAREAELRLTIARDAAATVHVGGAAPGAQRAVQRAWDCALPEVERANRAIAAFTTKLATSADGRAAARDLARDLPPAVAIDDFASRAKAAQVLVAVRAEIVDRLERLRRALLLLERRRLELDTGLANAVREREAWLEGA
jgi:hypothetical protein